MSLSEEKGNVETISLSTLTRRSPFVDESLTGRTQDFTTSASALLSPTLPKKGAVYQSNAYNRNYITKSIKKKINIISCLPGKTIYGTPGCLLSGPSCHKGTPARACPTTLARLASRAFVARSDDVIPP